MIAQSPTALDAPYWSGLTDGKLCLPRCAHCDHWQWPAVARCGECGHWGSSWHERPLEGTIFSWTRTWHPFGGTEALAKPFVSILAEIDGTDGKRLMGLLEGIADSDPVPIGAAVTGRIGATAYGDDSVPVILWRMVDKAEKAA